MSRRGPSRRLHAASAPPSGAPGVERPSRSSRSPAGTSAGRHGREPESWLPSRGEGRAPASSSPPETRCHLYVVSAARHPWSRICPFFTFQDLFHLVTWDDLDLYYGHKAQEMILTDVSDTIHADSLALFALNIGILLADVTKPEKSKILTLTWPVTSSVTSGSNFWPCTGSSRTGLSNGVWNLEIGPVVWEISGGPFGPPPPSGRVTIQTPAGRGLSGRIMGTLPYLTGRGKWGKMCHGVNKSTPFSQLLLFQSPPCFYWMKVVIPCFVA